MEKPKPKEIAIFAEHTQLAGTRAWKIEENDDRATEDAFWTFADEEQAAWYDRISEGNSYGCGTATFHRRVAVTIREAM